MKHIFAVLCSFLITIAAAAQCTPPVAPPVLACGTGTPLTNNVTINSGQTYSYNGTGGSFSNITVNGGTLLLCGTVSLSNVNVNSGSIVINEGANVTFGGSFNVGSDNFFNAGNVTFNLNVAIQGSNTFVYNAATGVIHVNGSMAVFDNGLFINMGVASANSVTINSSAQICFGPGASASTTSITNNNTNAVSVPVGKACISYSSTFTGNNPISNTPNLHICQQPGATDPVPAVIGSATIDKGCTDCNSIIGVPLPLRLLSFTGRHESNGTVLQWESAWEENVQAFVVEYSSDGMAYEALATVPANNRPSRYQYTAPAQGSGFYRLKTVDLDGRFMYSSPLRVQSVIKGLQLTVLSNPVTGQSAGISIQSERVQTGDLLLADNMGRTIRKFPVSLSKGTNNIHLPLDKVGAGQYYLHFISRLERSATVALIRQ